MKAKEECKQPKCWRRIQRQGQCANTGRVSFLKTLWVFFCSFSFKYTTLKYTIRYLKIFSKTLAYHEFNKTWNSGVTRDKEYGFSQMV